MLLAVALAAGLAACDPGDEPTEPPSSDGTTTATEPATTDPSSDVPTPPDLDAPTPPEAIGVDNRDGAAAAVEHFFALLDYARATGDVGGLASLSASDCVYCSTRIESIEALHTDNGWAESPGSTLSDLAVTYPTADQPEYFVTFTLTSPDLTIHHGDGSLEQVPGGTNAGFAAAVVWEAGGFLISGINSGTDG